MNSLIARLSLSAVLAAALFAGPAWADEEDELLRGPGSTSAAKVPTVASELKPSPDALQDPADAAEEAVKAALARLVAVEVALARGQTGSSRDELESMRDELHGALIALGQLRQDRDLRKWAVDEGYVLVPAGTQRDTSRRSPREPEPTARALSDDDIDSLQREIEGAPFNEGKLSVLQDGIAGRTLVARQAEQLLELFSFSRDRVDVLVFLHPRLARGEDFSRLLAALKFESDRQAVRDRLGLGT